MKFFPRTNDLFDTVFDDMFTSPIFSTRNDMAMKTDITEKDGKYLLDMELPGCKKEDIHLELKDGLLTISAQHHAETEEKKENYVRRERRYGRYTRSFDVSNIDTAAIRARYENGILYLNLPKAKPAQPVSQQIAIE